MNKFIYALAVVTVLGTSFALAEQPENPGGDHTCQGGHNCNDGGGTQETTNENTANSTSTSNAAAVSGSNSSSSSSASGGDVRSDIRVSVGGPRSSSSASSGDATGGRATSGTNSSITIEGDDHDVAASSAAAVFAGECQNGGSGQVEAGGFAVVNQDQFCQHVKAARVMLDAYNWEMNNGSFECTTVEYGFTTPAGEDTVVETLQEVCGSEKAMEYLSEYRHHVEAATSLVRRTEVVGLMDSISGYLVRPVALIAVLILLL